VETNQPLRMWNHHLY